MKNPVLLILCLLLVTGLASAQAGNLLKNGDFSAGMNLWVGSGHGANPLTGQPHLATPVTEKFDTTGYGVSDAFTVLPGGNTNLNPNNPPYVLTQKALVMPAPMELHMDVCVTGPNGNAQGGHLKIKIANTEVAAWAAHAPSFTAGTYRYRLTFLFTPKVAGMQDVTIELWRERYIWSWSSATAHTPKICIDNLFLAPAQKPSLTLNGQAKAGGSLVVDLGGKAGNAGALLLSPGMGPGVVLPGLGGTFMLNPASFFLLSTGAFDTSGVFKTSLPLPNDPMITGVALYWQGVEVGTGGGSFGYMHKFCIN